MAADTAVDIIVRAIVTKSLRKRPECNDYIFNRVKQVVYREVEQLVRQGQSQLDIILLEKKRLEAIFCSEKLMYKATKDKKIIDYSDEDDYDDTNNDGGEAKNDTGSAKPDGKEKTSKKYFEYLAEYKNDNDVYERVKGVQMRGKNFPVSNNGSCPKCSYKSNMFVVLDFLFPIGDMPEILHYLLTLGKALLWSSKENVQCKDPPTFICQGKCPSEIGKCGFNINWNKTDLDKIFLFPEENYKEPPKSKVIPVQKAVLLPGNKSDLDGNKSDSNSDFVDEDSCDEEYDEGVIDIEYYKKNVSWVVLDEVSLKGNGSIEAEEDSIIRNMLALEKAREDYINGVMKQKLPQDSNESDEEEITHSSEADITMQEKKNNTNVLNRKETVSNLVHNTNLGVKNKIENTSSNGKLKKKATPVANPPLPITDYRLSKNTSCTVDPPLPKTDFEVSKNANKRMDSPRLPAATDYRLSKAPNISMRPKSTGFSDGYIKGKGNSKDSVNALMKTTPTPTHILKGATYYDPSKDVKSSKPAFTVDDFPISKDGACPYCHSKDVLYIILQEDETDDLPELLVRLHAEGKAVKKKKGEYDLPSFQCKGCTYGFNLDWNCTNLEKIFTTPPPAAKANTSMVYPSVIPPAENYMFMGYQPQPYQQNFQSQMQNTMGNWNSYMQSMAMNYPTYNQYQNMSYGMMPQYNQVNARNTSWSQQNYRASYHPAPNTQVGNELLRMLGELTPNNRSSPKSTTVSNGTEKIKSQAVDKKENTTERETSSDTSTKDKMVSDKVTTSSTDPSEDHENESGKELELYTMDLEEGASDDDKKNISESNVSPSSKNNMKSDDVITIRPDTDRQDKKDEQVEDSDVNEIDMDLDVDDETVKGPSGNETDHIDTGTDDTKLVTSNTTQSSSNSPDSHTEVSEKEIPDDIENKTNNACIETITETDTDLHLKNERNEEVIVNATSRDSDTGNKVSEDAISAAEEMSDSTEEILNEDTDTPTVFSEENGLVSSQLPCDSSSEHLDGSEVQKNAENQETESHIDRSTEISKQNSSKKKRAVKSVSSRGRASKRIKKQKSSREESSEVSDLDSNLSVVNSIKSENSDDPTESVSIDETKEMNLNDINNATSDPLIETQNESNEVESSSQAVDESFEDIPEPSKKKKAATRGKRRRGRGARKK